MPDKKRRAVITGLGPITAIGIGREEFWNGLRAEKSGVRTVTMFDSSIFNAHCAAEIPAWAPEKFFPPHRLKRLDRYAQFSVASAQLALEDAGIKWSKEEPQHRVGVSFGTALGGIANAESEHAHFLKKGSRAVNQTLALQVFGGSAHTNIAIEFGFRGAGTTNSNSCASGTIAVGEALRYIRDDFADVIVAGGAESPLSQLTYGAFAFIKTMSQHAGDPAEACRPFDRLRDGFVMGEGAASLVIEELEHARARGAHIYAEVLGYSLNNDAFHMTSPLPSGESSRPRDARVARRRRACAGRHRLHQRPRQLDPAERQHRDAGHQGSLRRARCQDAGQRHEGFHRSSAGRDRRYRGGALRACDRSRLDPADAELGKSRSRLRSRRCPAARPGSETRLRLEQLLRLRRDQLLRRARPGARLIDAARTRS